MRCARRNAMAEPARPPPPPLISAKPKVERGRPRPAGVANLPPLEWEQLADNAQTSIRPLPTNTYIIILAS